MTPPPLIFEETTSPLVQSNDGRLFSYENRVDGCWDVVDQQAPYEVLLQTHERAIADAYIAGYDLATDATNSSDLSPRSDSA